MPFFEEVTKCDQAIEVDTNRTSEMEAHKNIPVLSRLIESLLERVYSYHDKFPSYVKWLECTMMF